ncbi:hypothetical protein F441_10086 [Phytophthora nicotianae CJ01A1]|uniref:RxLR effector protein n=7 Tax=Phytophthora nicotianae TaxID=4792 RepID=W2R873_PHYN3|nr:hypothetical protein PPTG_01613 [Phytophthora nicotianae INRA-310]ETI45160.1 hypothetical protein F443_10145 [Phytophthora nicotianae P1569]ETK85180.1 hypothetical protein L915_09926 [Phytophthora nicotianae]ETO73816.1 hypothetical protein F444_10242 [Phytophthora nicotianae P1976]ETP15026.1 hypothetical protein F441_10086 [Phytophthora nicotianae CJ01A1]ETP43098.1 hypothetical protein F442_10050 [Phytophthora nicotianae P10297]
MASASTQMKPANIASLGVIQPDNAASTRSDDERFLGAHKTDDGGKNIGSYNTGSEEREFQSAAKAASTKLTTKLGTEWKKITNKDFRNLLLFLDEKTTFAKLYRKGATPFKLFTEMNHRGILKEGVISVRWSNYMDYWVKRNTGLI